jgi:hypothetical protein
VSEKVVPNDQTKASIQAEGNQGLPKRSPIDDAIEQMFPGRKFSEDEMAKYRSIMSKKAAEGKMLNFKDAMLPTFEAFKLISDQIRELIAEDPEQYTASDKIKVLDEIEFNASEKEMYRTVAKRKLENAQEQADPENKLGAGQKMEVSSNKKPKLR